MLSRSGLVALALSALFAFAPKAFAHVSIASGPGTAGQNAVVTFSVGHGCEGADTYKIEVALPTEITSVRGMPSTFGPVDMVRNAADVVTAVSWTKSAPVRELDDGYYQLGIRIGVPNTPWKTLYFKIKQTCRKADGTESVVNWDALPADLEGAADSEETPPAAELLILPPRAAGWNKFSVTDKIEDLSIFDDAQIVWSGDAAYSKNPTTAELIKNEDGVTELTEIAAGAEIWVKY